MKWYKSACNLIIAQEGCIQTKVWLMLTLRWLRKPASTGTEALAMMIYSMGYICGWFMVGTLQ